jgi:hypothetical protein
MIANDAVEVKEPTVQRSCAAFEAWFLDPACKQGHAKKLRDRSIQLEVKQPNNFLGRGSFSLIGNSTGAA